MDENNLEIATTVEPMGFSSNQLLSIAGGFALGLTAGILVEKFLITPVINKIAEKKASKKEADGDKAES